MLSRSPGIQVVGNFSYVIQQTEKVADGFKMDSRSLKEGVVS